MFFLSPFLLTSGIFNKTKKIRLLRAPPSNLFCCLFFRIFFVEAVTAPKSMTDIEYYVNYQKEGDTAGTQNTEQEKKDPLNNKITSCDHQNYY